MNARYTDGRPPEVFFDTKTTTVIKKIVRPIAEQEENESRRYGDSSFIKYWELLLNYRLFSLWKDVTYYLKAKQMDKATGGKTFLEQRQRHEAKERAEKREKWQTKVKITFEFSI